MSICLLVRSCGRSVGVFGAAGVRAMSGSATVEAPLYERWTELCSRDRIRTTEARQDWWRVVKASMFQHFDRHQDKIQNRNAVAWAIFFHDVVYDAKASDNEARSAEMFHHFATENLQKPPDCIRETERLIMLTKEHVTEEHRHKDRYGTKDEHYFLDFDMSVLGWPEQDYDVYAEQIRQEYVHIPLDQYKERRAMFLKKSMSETANIFSTKEFREQFEKQARQNMNREIQHLQAIQVTLGLELPAR
ncbi:PREDICTED: uncharacterized protein LOC109486334 isoform X2 [Branchiostoma belcheri]|uniref:Uncharacterized protein LOC109486334 isoform X2 n=1 Tax=Branchiostoma belcheri TaxID=7741 RepID=A0A6P5ARM7_BRABE|nr:PREDICTED: uncharacterized protein LOC109486334 isoform X2 [Branchiostoma belcheri]